MLQNICKLYIKEQELTENTGKTKPAADQNEPIKINIEFTSFLPGSKLNYFLSEQLQLGGAKSHMQKLHRSRTTLLYTCVNVFLFILYCGVWDQMSPQLVKPLGGKILNIVNDVFLKKKKKV